MPILDMPLEQLKEYRGINPCPGDHEAYWEKGLEEMRGVERNVEVKDADLKLPNFEFKELRFTGVKGARIFAKYVRPAGAKGKKLPAVLIFHGYSCRSMDWTELLIYASLGFAVFAMDCRGQGGQSEDVGGVKGNTLNGQIIRGLADEPENLYFRQVFLDTAELADIVMGMEDIDEEKVAACGGSQGGALTLACASLEPRIVKIAPMFPFLCDYKRVWEMDLAGKNAYKELTEFFRRFDPRHERIDEWFTKLGYIDVQYLVSRIKAEVMFTTGLMDSVCPPSTQFAAYNKINSKKELMVYPDFGHEMLPEWPDKALTFLSTLLS